jgi:hypothetical protein
VRQVLQNWGEGEQAVLLNDDASAAITSSRSWANDGPLDGTYLMVRSDSGPTACGPNEAFDMLPTNIRICSNLCFEERLALDALYQN